MRLRTRGFSLVELMITLAVAAILLAAGVPGFQAVVNGNRLAGAANELMAGLQTARMEAIRRNRRVAVCASANAEDGEDATCAAANINGFITFVDEDADGDFDKGGDILLRNAGLPTRVEVGGTTFVSYRADGLARDAGGALLAAGAVRLRINATLPQRNVRCVAITTGGTSVSTPEAHDADCS